MLIVLPRLVSRLNAKLELNGIPPMNDLAKDLSDGVKLIQLMVVSKMLNLLSTSS